MAIRASWSLPLLLALATPATPQDCRLALVLALDVSGSVSAREDQLQRQGLAAAMMAPEVQRAFVSGDPVALYVFQWSDLMNQEPLLSGWEMIEDEADVVQAAQTIAQSRCERGVSRDPPTALGAALAHASYVLSHGPDCRQRIVDVSGDGQSNSWLEPRVVYESKPFGGVTVNALLIRKPEASSELVAWFAQEVLHGPGAFLIVADGFEDYERAMQAKLRRELELRMVSGLRLITDGT
jgi:hypothetical protein